MNPHSEMTSQSACFIPTDLSDHPIIEDIATTPKAERISGMLQSQKTLPASARYQKRGFLPTSSNFETSNPLG